jgi:hypothetical protein
MTDAPVLEAVVARRANGEVLEAVVARRANGEVLEGAVRPLQL